MFFGVPGVCHMCAYNVPDVCAYLGVHAILKYNIRGFQRRVARLHTTKARPYSSGQSGANLGQICKSWKKK